AQTHELASAVHAAFERPFDLGGNEVYVDAAVGMSLFPLDADNATVLLRHADQAAAQAKRPGEGPTHQSPRRPATSGDGCGLPPVCARRSSTTSCACTTSPSSASGRYRLTARLPRISRVTSSLRRRSCAGRTATV
ncbi:MAG: diguanylate cyclase, partial [Actinomycetota bacterium]|nr:diguanylate cyclase [Actinomycetota bacterium]